jgi:hypothetical protein
MSKRSPLRTSDPTPKVKQRMAAQFLASRNTNSPWPEISRNAGISEQKGRRCASTEMMATAQHERRGHASRTENPIPARFDNVNDEFSESFQF